MKKYTAEEILNLIKQLVDGEIEVNEVGDAIALCENRDEILNIINKEIKKRKL